jgi:hypothetical protein
VIDILLRPLVHINDVDIVDVEVATCAKVVGRWGTWIPYDLVSSE